MLHLVPGETGGSELYARRLAEALVEHGGVEVVAFVPAAAAASFEADAFELVTVPLDARSRARRVLAEQTLLRGRGGEARIDLLHNLFTTAPAFPGAPQVTTVLDVIYKRFPEAHSGLRAKGLGALAALSARRSRRIIAISEAGKADIVEYLGVEPDRIDVTYLGPALPDTKTVSEPELRARLDLGEAPIVLTASAKLPHKNLERLLDAFAAVRSEPPPVLVVPGYRTFHEQPLIDRAAAGGAEDRIRFVGWVADDVLDGLYRAATCFVFPSLAEGFGLPVLDALVRGTPVATSSASSLPEVAGEAALYFDPLDTAAIAEAIERLLGDAALRERLRAAGAVQGTRFSWTETAERTVASYARALGSNVP